MLEEKLTASQFKKYKAALNTSHMMRVRIHKLDVDEEFVSELTPWVLEGTVDVDSETDTNRHLSLTFVDQNNRISFSKEQVFDGALYADNFIKVFYDVWVATLSKWVSVPVFTGPVIAYSRTGPEVTVEAVSKESLLIPPIRTHRREINSNLVRTIIRQSLHDAGERQFNFDAGLTARVAKKFHLAVPKDKGLWPMLKRLAKNHNYELFYNADGEVVLRKQRKTTHNILFHDEQGGNVLSIPTVTYDLSEVRNRVLIFQENSDTNKQSLIYRRSLPPHHPMSPQSLARHGSPRVIPEEFTYDKKVRFAVAKEKGDTLLRLRSLASVEANFTSLPVPYAEVGDIARLKTEDVAVTFQLKKFSLPLTSGDEMSIGFHRRPSQLRKRIVTRRNR